MVQVSNGSDDAEEGEDGSIQLNSSDLELVADSGAGLQTVGIRFAGIEIPQGVQIARAYIEFEADETSSAPATLTITAQDSDNAATFTSAAYDISSRLTVPDEVVWDNISAWETVNEKHQTPDLSRVVQDVINRGGWISGNAMVFIINGTGVRTAESLNGERQAAPTLYIEYNFGPQVNRAPVVVAGIDQTVSLPAAEGSLNGSVSDDGLPAGILTTSWSQLSGPGTAVFYDTTNVDTSVTFDAVGEYVLQLEADDGEYIVADTINISVTEPDITPPSIPLNLTANPVSGSQIDLNWEASTDNVAISGYIIYQDGISLTTVTGTSYSDTGLSSMTTYVYTVEAIDPSFNYSGESDPVSATTPEEIYQVMVQVSNGSDDAEEGEDGSIQLNSSDLELVADSGAGLQT
ncbi:MAG: fibronectin type III domain-containing protein, partial [Gammaproteobacteria bacterium]|nr:fibronectin type III domain-containing protein [Gammaproteobacteria bacterium]